MSDADLRSPERQVERGSLLTHSALGRAGARTREVESFIFGLLDALLAREAVTLEEDESAVVAARRGSTSAASRRSPPSSCARKTAS